MDSWIAAAGLITLGAITPGPNNLIMMRESARGGWRRAVPVAIGIVVGGLALLVTVASGARGLSALDPGAGAWVRIGASLVLACLGLDIILAAGRPRSAPPSAPRRGTVAALFVLQFLNPKAWVLVTAVVSSLGPAPQGRSVLQLSALFVLVPTLCLAAWSLLGQLVAARLAPGSISAWLDRLTGVLVLGFSLLLLVGGLDVS